MSRRHDHDRRSEERLIITRASDLHERETKWLWPSYLPEGYITLIQGDPGLGKSTVTLEIAARVSRGESLPRMNAGNAPANVAVLSAEDGAEDVIKPRLRTAGADLDRVHIIGEVTRDHERRPIVLPGDVAHIRKECCERGVKLLILDPLIAFLMSNMNSFKDQDVRLALGPLAALAHEIGLTVLVVVHLNKRSDERAMYRGGGSIAFTAAARSVLVLAADPADGDQRVLASIEGNICRRPPALGFRILDESGVGRIEWTGERDLTADDLLAAPDQKRDVLRSNVRCIYSRSYLRRALPWPWRHRNSLAKRGLVPRRCGAHGRS
jgi:hypothetical protein